MQQMLAAGHAPLVLCAPQIRLAFRRFFEVTFADSERAFLLGDPRPG